MSKIKSILNLLRVRQYYKNVLVFVGAFFAVRIMSFNVIFILLLGFVLLCCASSINYIINDLLDIEKDKHHEEKLEKKPLASGDISKLVAIFILSILIGIIILAFIFSFLISLPNLGFLVMILVLITTGQLYNNVFKRYAFADIVVLSLHYLWRTLAGCLIINVYISPWLLLAICELAMFLGFSKRKGDLLLLGQEKAKEHKKAYQEYSIPLLNQFQTMISASVFITYALYLIIRFNIFAENAITINDYVIFLTLPVLFYILMRYNYLTNENPEMARSTEKAFRDKGMLVAGLIFGLFLSYAFYYEPALEYLIQFLSA